MSAEVHQIRPHLRRCVVIRRMPTGVWDVGHFNGTDTRMVRGGLEYWRACMIARDFINQRGLPLLIQGEPPAADHPTGTAA